MPAAVSILANDSLLLLTAAIWGLAFVAQRVGMEHVGPFTYNAVRFALGSLSLVPLILVRSARARQRPPAQAGPPAMKVIPAGLLAGGVLFFGASLQQIGIVSTTAGKAGFITGLYVVLVPLAGLLWAQRAGASAWVGAALSLAGLFLLSVTESFTIARGDLLVLIGAFFWAVHVQVVGWLSPRVDPVRLACTQFAVCAALSALGAALTEWVRLSAVLSAAIPILYGGVMSVGVAYTLQVVAQRKAPPAHAAILLSLESAFAALGGSLFLGERLGLRGTVGCLIMFAGMLVSQVPLFARRKRWRRWTRGHACVGPRPRIDSPPRSAGMHESTLDRIAQILKRLPGVIGVSSLTDDQRMHAVEIETRYESSSAIPVRNLGVALLAARAACLVVLKDGSFRPPQSPTVYLVEHDACENARQVIEVEGKRYAVVGEEAVDGAGGYSEPVIPLEDSFVIFPERRSGPRVPCSFILPPISFPELEREAAALGISAIISISPSLAADAFVRGLFGFPQTNAFATLLIGFNFSPA